MSVLSIPLDHTQISGHHTKMYFQGKGSTCMSKWLNEDILHGQTGGSTKDVPALKIYSWESYKPWESASDFL